MITEVAVVLSHGEHLSDVVLLGRAQPLELAEADDLGAGVVGPPGRATASTRQGPVDPGDWRIQRTGCAGQVSICKTRQ